ncbi:MAG: CAAD domain-containing protein [Leptolyngbyaceae cyanobacterium]
MESNVNKDPNISGSSEASTPSSAAITTLPSSSSDQSTEAWPDNTQKLNTFIQEVPSFLEDFWGKYGLPILLISLVLGFVIFTKVLVAVLGAINDLPLLQPFFEIVGISYSGWFLIRYLLPSTGREELGESIRALTDRVKGSTQS